MTFVYYLGVSLLFTHELDAVLHSEWKLLFVLRSLDGDVASSAFIVLHLPLFVLFFWLGHHVNDKVQQIFRLAVAAFLVIHALLHFSLSEEAAYEFHGALSNALIYSAAAAGLLYGFLAYRQKRQTTQQDDRSASQN